MKSSYSKYFCNIGFWKEYMSILIDKSYPVPGLIVTEENLKLSYKIKI